MLALTSSRRLVLRELVASNLNQAGAHEAGAIEESAAPPGELAYARRKIEPPGVTGGPHT
jgi:hypothetical protein